MNRNLVLMLLAVCFCCTSFMVASGDKAKISTAHLASVDLQGHRGARGFLPENTIPAFIYPLEVGVTTLETDIAINAGGHAVHVL